ncbi:R.Pab1 family restriction endonuclease [Helicobacter sp. NHP22-001]|uniref:R.Pab1 family restriction endonuclease n=1 Tax=Helicobacter sp. NHP22-001 TaxID=3040202 RepID=UPI003321A268
MGMQPMLYVCIPITHLNTATPLLGRRAGLKECGFYFRGRTQRFLLELFKIFATLSPNHHHDILQILEVILCTRKT